MDISSYREAALSSHHFLVICKLNISIPKTESKPRIERYDYSQLRNHQAASIFAHNFTRQLASFDNGAGHMDINSRNHSIEEAFHSSMQQSSATKRFQPKRPWITESTLKLIERRHQARLDADIHAERSLQHLIKKFVRRDRETYLRSLAGSGDWNKLRELRKGKKPS